MYERIGVVCCLLVVLHICTCEPHRPEYSRLYDARSELSREVLGYPRSSQRLDISRNDSLVLVDNLDDVPGCASGEVNCYQGVYSPGGEDDLLFPEDVSFPALKLLLEQKRITLIDVRNSTELETVGEIPGSVNVPLHEIPEAFQLSPDQFLEKYKFQLPQTTAKNIVLTCRSGRRILIAQKRLKPLGYNHLRLYRGSFKEWVAKGGQVHFSKKNNQQ